MQMNVRGLRSNMPTYAFYCEACEERWEDFQPISLDKHESTCPKCGKILPQSWVGVVNGFAFVDRHWNPVPGFPGNDAKIKKQIKDSNKEIDSILPKYKKK